ncbi:MAG: hypothetical protein NW200_12800 [Hyphomonadaceae bacterium]|nr:hypothetical protein [Hyphomonadaceae bacterium]
MRGCKTILAAAAVLTATACGAPPSPPSPAAPALESTAGAGAGCAAEAAIDWAPRDAGPYQITARAAGETCGAGEASIAVKDATGKVLYSGAFDVAVMTNTIFADAKTPETTKAALLAWIDPQSSAMETTRALPDWPAGAEQPQSGEFPFYPAEGLTRDAYLRLRAQDKPLYCFVQGGESMKCIALDAAANAMTDVGVQSFPG